MHNKLLKSQINNEIEYQKRIKCIVCNYIINQNDESAFKNFACNVRAFKDETFNVWRCPTCQTIHCLEILDLQRYYAKYPIAQAKPTLISHIIHQNISRRLIKHGFCKTHSLLDYGCGNGLFLKYLQQRSFTNCYGYDLYAPEDGFGDRKTLQYRPFDYILLQDVIEHVEDPNELLCNLNSLLAPGGYILIGTPNAERIDLMRPNLPDIYNEVHVPYHLHIYTRKSLESLASSQGWKFVDIFNRSWQDTRWFTINSRACNQYQKIVDGSLDACYEPPKTWKALTSYKYLFYAIFGYWLSFQTDMAIVFQKS